MLLNVVPDGNDPESPERLSPVSRLQGSSPRPGELQRVLLPRWMPWSTTCQPGETGASPTKASTVSETRRGSLVGCPRKTRWSTLHCLVILFGTSVLIDAACSSDIIGTVEPDALRRRWHRRPHWRPL